MIPLSHDQRRALNIIHAAAPNGLSAESLVHARVSMAVLLALLDAKLIRTRCHCFTNPPGLSVERFHITDLGKDQLA